MPRKKNCPDVDELRRLAKTQNLAGIAEHYGISVYTLRRWLDDFQIVVPASNFLPVKRPVFLATKDWCRGCLCEIPYNDDTPFDLRFCDKRKCQKLKELREAKNMLNELKRAIRRQAPLP